MKPTKSLKQKNVSICYDFYTEDDIKEMEEDTDTFFTSFDGETLRISLSKVKNVFVDNWNGFLVNAVKLYDGRVFYVEI